MVHIVLGSFFGDEGKGQTVHELCKEYDIKWVIRFSGGHQVGHTVIEGNKKHVFSNFGPKVPSSILGNVTFITN